MILLVLMANGNSYSKNKTKAITPLFPFSKGGNTAVMIWPER